MAADSAALNAAPEHFPVRVRMVESVNGATSPPQIAAGFISAEAAESFIRSEIAKCPNFGKIANRHWCRHHADHQVHYWIETDQETASVKDAG